MNKKLLFGIYSLAVIILLGFAEFRTLPLLNSDLSFKAQKPSQGAVLQYGLSPIRLKTATSMYRGDLERHGSIKVTSSARFKKFQLKWQVENLNNGIHRASKSSPAVDESGFYTADDTGFLRAYSWTGQLRWQFYSGVSSRGFHSTPLLDEDSIYIGDYAGYIFSLNKSDGGLRWITKAGTTIGSSFLLNQGILLVGVELPEPNGFLLALNAQTGKWLWKSDFLGNHPHSSPALSLSTQLVLMGANTGNLEAFDLNGKRQWSYASKDDIKCSPAIYKDRVYFASWDGFFYSLDIKSGILKWRTALDDSSMSCPSITNDGSVIAITGYKNNYVLDSRNGQILWSKPIDGLNGRAQSSPLILQYANQDGVAFLCDKESLCFYDLKNGQELQRLHLQSSFSASPVFYNDHLFIATSGKSGFLVFSPEQN